MTAGKFKRVLLKLSGDFMCDESGFGVDPATSDQVAQQVKRAYDLGVEIAIVIGAGNIWRGGDALARGMDRATAYAYLSAAANFSVSQVVDKTVGVHAQIAKDHFVQRG